MLAYFGNFLSLRTINIRSVHFLAMGMLLTNQIVRSIEFDEYSIETKWSAVHQCAAIHSLRLSFRYQNDIGNSNCQAEDALKYMVIVY